MAPSRFSISPYKLGLDFVKATGLDRVFRSRVSKSQPSPTQNRRRTPGLEAALARATLADVTPKGSPSADLPSPSAQSNVDASVYEDSSMEYSPQVGGASAEDIILETVETEVEIKEEVYEEYEYDEEPEDYDPALEEYDRAVDDSDGEDSAARYRQDKYAAAEDPEGENTEDHDADDEAMADETMGDNDNADEGVMRYRQGNKVGSGCRKNISKTSRQPDHSEGVSYEADVEGDTTVLSQRSQYNPFSKYSRDDRGNEDEEAELSDEPPPPDGEVPEMDWPVDDEIQRNYQDAKDAIPGQESWGTDLDRLHRLLSLRGRHPLMPGTWAWDLLDLPMLPELFAPPTSEKPVLIHAMSSQFRASKALRTLFELQGRINALRQAGKRQKISITIKKEIERYIKWAKEDAGLQRYDYQPNIITVRYDRVDVSPQELATMMGDGLSGWAKQYRRRYRAKGIQQYPRVLYCFVIIQQLVLVATLKVSDREPKPLVFAQMNVSHRDRWLDSGLGIAIPVLVAREALLKYRNDFPELELEESDDPDL
ncbi:hypothetical protein NKR23_g4588 [Pleurostoma richardsiae]|uniref:Uncharacterized protein n=1 Tax=Pleurostoma richardsiae TaxID=41990 RepID=A0AA38RIZ0_9PEZI|nr:hypothetical protein NKR23_g4588 [Pleurostoma richardsiae]